MSAQTKEQALREAVQDDRDGRLSRQVARLLDAQRSNRTISTATSRAASRSKRPTSSPRSASRSIGRSGRMTPQTVDAYNGGLENKIVFPAGILQAPLFNPDADPAVNYGAIGAIIGHEITHGFDDQGRKIDATGALRDWWTPEDAEALRRRERQARRAIRQLRGRARACTSTAGSRSARTSPTSAACSSRSTPTTRRSAAVRRRHRRPDRRPAPPPRLRAGVARQGARRCAEGADGLGPALAAAVPRDRTNAKRRRLVRVLRRHPGPEVLPESGGSRSRLVTRDARKAR